MESLKGKTEYIDVIDLTTQTDKAYFRKVSFGYSPKHPISLELLGNLSHCTEITFDSTNAKKLIAWLEYLISSMEANNEN